MKFSESIQDLAVALCAAQGEMKAVKKEADNPFFNSTYASLEGVIKHCRPILFKNGLSIVQGPSGDGDVVIVHTLLLHSSGQWIETETTVKPVPVKIDRGSAEKAVTPQATGSAITYARRYGYMAIIGLASSDDDDGSTASQTKKSFVTPQEDLGTFPDIITDVRQSKRGELVVYTIKTQAGYTLTTIEVEVATKAKNFKGFEVLIESEPTKYGPRVLNVTEKE